MKILLLALHLSAVGMWLGCVITEALFERALLGKGREQELLLSSLHKRVDLVVEIPAFLGVLITGLLMLPHAASSTIFMVKLGFGLLALAANIVCVGIVFKRAKAANTGDWDSFAQLDHLQHKIGAVVLIGLLVALGCGLYLLAHS